MKPYLLALAAGLLVGLIYSVLNIRSPAPPLVALVGLLGILVGEQLLPVGRHLVAGTSLTGAWGQARAHYHIFGPLPGRHASADPEISAVTPAGPKT
jgi:XapX domain-containing protein